MPYCPNCGAKLPEEEEVRFCPNCGAPVRVISRPTYEIRRSVTRFVAASLLGAMISVMIASSSTVNLFFLPSFIASVIVVYLYRMSRFEESLVTSLAIYLFADGIMAVTILGYCYMLQTPYATFIEDWVPELWEVLLYGLNPVSAFVAAYIGMKISPRRRRMPTVPERGRGGVIYLSNSSKTPKTSVDESLSTCKYSLEGGI